MAIDQQDWRSISHHGMILAFLRAEKASALATGLYSSAALDRLLDAPDLNDRAENLNRITLLECFRGAIFDHFPAFTDWFEVRFLTHPDLPLLHNIYHPHWTNGEDKNELIKVAARKPTSLKMEPHEWEAPILIGHQKEGPFVIIEGNNRLTGYAGSGRTDLKVRAVIGLSHRKCGWNPLDW